MVIDTNQKILTELQRTLRLLKASRVNLVVISETSRQNHNALRKLLEKLGADRQLLAYVDSWGEGQPDDEVLRLIKQWNDAEEEERS